jgi:hypothetical protein
VRDPDQHSSDDELYAWFIGYIDGPGQRARELRDGVIEIVLEEDGVDPQRVELLLTRKQLRAGAWSDVDIFDDRVPDVLQPATNPVLAGLNALSMYIDEALATLRPDEAYVVYHHGMFRGSVVPDVPPVRGTHSGFDVAPGSGGFWSAYGPDDPHFGEPGSILGAPEQCREAGRGEGK